MIKAFPQRVNTTAPGVPRTRRRQGQRRAVGPRRSLRIAAPDPIAGERGGKRSRRRVKAKQPSRAEPKPADDSRDIKLSTHLTFRRRRSCGRSVRGAMRRVPSLVQDLRHAAGEDARPCTRAMRDTRIGEHARVTRRRRHQWIVGETRELTVRLGHVGRGAKGSGREGRRRGKRRKRAR